MASEKQAPLGEPKPDPLVGKRVQDRYRILQKLGQGGMGAVYLAEHELIRKRVALKCLHPALAADPEVVRRFHQEAVAATAIGHPHIVDVTDMGRFDDGSFFMVLEFLQGHDWQRELNRTGPQPLERVAHIALQVCDALAVAGRKGIVHRDLKPENIFLIERHGDPDFVKVLDFGISKVQSEQGGGTKTGALLGTPSYMAPEQVRGARDIDQQADVYAMGVVLYQALSGQLPFTGASLLDLIMKITTDTPVLLATRLPALPPELARLVDRMLQKDPAQRPHGFDEVSALLRPFDTIGPVRARSLIPPSSEPPASPSASSERPAAPELGATPPLARPAVSAAPPPPATRSARPLVVLGGLGVGLLALVLVAWPRDRAPSIAPAPTPAGSSMVRVQISTIPPDAELTLDGKPITNPFDGQLARGDGRSNLRATRVGFEPSERSLVLSTEQRVFIQLTPETPSPEAPHSAAPPPPNRPQATATKPAATAVAIESESPPPAPEPAAPRPASVEPPPVATEPPKLPLKKVF